LKNRIFRAAKADQTDNWRPKSSLFDQNIARNDPCPKNEANRPLAGCSAACGHNSRETWGLKSSPVADRVLIDQAALLALRARQMRDDLLAGEKPICDRYF
jgi:hypothetical protein